MSFWAIENLRTVVGGSWLARPESSRPGEGLSIDSRATRPGQVFLALRGERVDGHAYLAQAAEAGAALAIIDDPMALPVPLPRGLAVLKVADTRRALLKLGGAYRRTLERTRVIAVGGSNGKTTTVRLLESVLTPVMPGSASIKSFNNHIGVPLTILAAKPTDKYLICEIGTNAPGEIAQLAEVVSPDISVITSIGREHLERLSSLKGVAQEEVSQLDYLRPGGFAVVSADAPHLAEMVGARPGRTVVTFGLAPEADVRVTDIQSTPGGVSFTINGREPYRIPLLGRHNAANAAAAIAVGQRLRLTHGQIASGLASARGAEMRLERAEVSGVVVLNDAYNANPDSMRAALDTLAEAVSPGRRVAVLGDMLELGEHAESSHREIGHALAEGRAADLVVFVGSLMRHAADHFAASSPGAPAVRIDDLDGDGAARVAACLRPGDTVLLKGSRRMRLERVLRALEGLAPAR